MITNPNTPRPAHVGAAGPASDLALAYFLPGFAGAAGLGRLAIPKASGRREKTPREAAARLLPLPALALRGGDELRDRALGQLDRGVLYGGPATVALARAVDRLRAPARARPIGRAPKRLLAADQANTERPRSGLARGVPSGLRGGLPPPQPAPAAV